MGKDMLKELFLSAVLLGGQQAHAVDFNRDIRPIIFGKCVECHGPATRKGDFRIDERVSATTSAASGATPIVVGKPDQSELLTRVTTLDLDERMPPKGEALTPAQIQSLRDWIAGGAEYQKHWADMPVTRPEPPEGSDHVIDSFVRAKLKERGMSPRARADRYILARRIALDLTGLQPSVDALKAFVNDDSPSAIEQYIDGLLASPHYGEKWARWWLDLARYADTNGYESDEPRTMWGWRDWVIRAFNDNIPFDQFTRMQMAGDLFVNPSLDDQVATGFHRNSLINTEGGSKEDEFKDAAIKDRVHTTFTVWMASTMECAQCHTHKYDPIEQKEYFQLYAFFNNTTDRGTGGESDQVEISLQDREELRRREAEVTRLKNQLNTPDDAFNARFETWLAEKSKVKPSSDKPIWSVIDPKSVVSEGGATLTRQPDVSYLASGANPAKDVYEVQLSGLSQPVAAIRLEALTDPGLPNQSLGRFSNGNFVMTDIEILVDGGKERIINAEADYAQGGYPIAHAIDQDSMSGWAVDGNLPDKRVPRTAVFRLASASTASELTLRLHFGSRFGQHAIGRFRVSVSDRASAPLKAGVVDPIEDALSASPRTAAQTDILRGHFRRMDPSSKVAIDAYEKALASLTKYKSAKKTTVMVMKEGKPRPAHVQERGDFLHPGEEVRPGVPDCFGLDIADAEKPDRLVLADWLVNPKNPRTARVTVNRLWDELFGRGLVATSEDFGVQGELPSHPALLDWLAAEFVSSGWDIKRFLKMVMLSKTYQQDARSTESEREADYYNEWLARGPRFRASAEMVRDIALQASGLLTPVIGGPSVFPPQPASIWENLFIEGGLKKWPESMGADRYRRGMYTYIKRTALHPMLRNFDAPSRSVCTVRRKRSNTPLAALNTLNDPAFVEFSGGLAQVLARHEGSVVDKITEGFLRCASRPPRGEELRAVQALLVDEYKKYHEDEGLARTLIHAAFVKPPTVDDPADLAAWIVVANILLNMDATLSKG